MTFEEYSQAMLDRTPTLRDYFAAAALQGCLAYSYVNPSSGNYQENATPELVAKAVYAYADAMLAEREASAMRHMESILEEAKDAARKAAQ